MQAEGKPVNHQLAKELLAGLVRNTLHSALAYSSSAVYRAHALPPPHQLRLGTPVAGGRRGRQAVRDQVRSPASASSWNVC